MSGVLLGRCDAQRHRCENENPQHRTPNAKTHKTNQILRDSAFALLHHPRSHRRPPLTHSLIRSVWCNLHYVRHSKTIIIIHTYIWYQHTKLHTSIRFIVIRARMKASAPRKIVLKKTKRTNAMNERTKKKTRIRAARAIRRNRRTRDETRVYYTYQCIRRRNKKSHIYSVFGSTPMGGIFGGELLPLLCLTLSLFLSFLSTPRRPHLNSLRLLGTVVRAFPQICIITTAKATATRQMERTHSE